VRGYRLDSEVLHVGCYFLGKCVEGDADRVGARKSGLDIGKNIFGTYFFDEVGSGEKLGGLIASAAKEAKTSRA
jgi:hypothetical protein